MNSQAGQQRDMNDWARRLTEEGEKISLLLQAELAENLVSCCIYGSAVRGDAVERRSGLNLFLLLRESNQASHAAISKVIGKMPNVDTFVVGMRGFDRTVRSFSAKFSSIRRHYLVLAGADVLSDLKIDVELERFLCEQALRNLQLRLGYNYIRRPRGVRYDRYLLKAVTTFLVHTSEILRLSGVAVAAKHGDRVHIISQTFGISESTLSGLLELRQHADSLAETEQNAWHERILEALDAVFLWLEINWDLNNEANAQPEAFI